MVRIADLEKEIASLKERLATLDARWEGVVVTSMWAGGTYNHARYYRRLEKQSLSTKLKRREKKLKKILKDAGSTAIRQD